MTRKRGAQPGNQNAYKHGFYSAHFQAEERRSLDQVTLTDLSGEIEMVRVFLHRLLEAQNLALPHLDLETQLSVLRAIALSTESINSMIRTQIILAQAVRESDKIQAKLMAPSAGAADPPEDPASLE